jgi:hypothetical protein
MPAATTAPRQASMAWLTHVSYPAIFTFDRRYHEQLITTVITPHRYKNPTAIKSFFDDIELHSNPQVASVARMSITGCTILEFNSETWTNVQMFCHKTMVDGTWPWFVHASRLRLCKPLGSDTRQSFA